MHLRMQNHIQNSFFIVKNLIKNYFRRQFVRMSLNIFLDFRLISSYNFLIYIL